MYMSQRQPCTILSDNELILTLVTHSSRSDTLTSLLSAYLFNVGETVKEDTDGAQTRRREGYLDANIQVAPYHHHEFIVLVLYSIQLDLKNNTIKERFKYRFLVRLVPSFLLMSRH